MPERYENTHLVADRIELALDGIGLRMSTPTKTDRAIADREIHPPEQSDRRTGEQRRLP